MKEPKMRAENLPPQTPLCTLAITLPEYTGPVILEQHLEYVQGCKFIDENDC